MPAIFIPRCLGLVFFVVSFATSAFANLVSYRATGTFTLSDFPADISPGDHFTIDFTFDDSVLDTDTWNETGAYPGALRSFDFGLTPGSSTGNYPGGFTTSKGTIATSEYSGLDRFYLSVNGGTFGTLGGHAFGGLLFVLDDPSQTSSIKDPGGTPSLGDVLHGPLDLSQFSETTVRISAIDQTGRAEGIVTSLNVVPEPSALSLLFTGFLVLVPRRNHRRTA